MRRKEMHDGRTVKDLGQWRSPKEKKQTGGSGIQMFNRSYYPRKNSRYLYVVRQGDRKQGRRRGELTDSAMVLLLVPMVLRKRIAMNVIFVGKLV